MENYKQASKLKLRFLTSVGQLSVEQLWELSLSQLSNAIKAVKTILKEDNDDDLSFLETTKNVDATNQLRFDILKDVYITKKSEIDEQRNAVANKAHNQKIDALIAEKQDGQLRDMSIEDLLKLRK